MLSQKQIGILGTGAYVPEAVLTNQDLEKLVATSAEWIVERSGIHERRIAAPEEDTVTMAVLAGRQALADAGIEPEQLSYIVLGTNTPAHFFPAGAIRVQEELGIGGQAAAFDLQAGCCGFNYALYVGERLVAPEGKYALIIGSDVCSRFTDWTDRSTCLLFGDGVYEVAAVLNGKLLDADRHLVRLGRSLAAIGIPNTQPAAAWLGARSASAAAPDLGVWAQEVSGLRVTARSGEHTWQVRVHARATMHYRAELLVLKRMD